MDKEITTISTEMDKKIKRETGKQNKMESGEKPKKIKLGTWNLRGIYEEGAIKSLTEEVKRYDLDIVAVQETHLKGNDIMEVGDYILFKSGAENRRDRKSVV